MKVNVGWAKELGYVAHGRTWIAAGYLVTAAIARKINKAQMDTVIVTKAINEQSGKREMVNFCVEKRYY